MTHDLVHESEQYDILKLENQMCFPLYACAKEVVRRYKPFLDVLELTYTQYIALMIIWEYKQINVKQLGEYLYLDSGTLTPLLKKLEKRGLVLRERSKEDERNLLVTVTDKGLALRDRAIDIPIKMAQCMNLQLDEVKTLYRLLYKILEQISG